MTISIITPWFSETKDLLPDYAAATKGAEVVTVDNATPPETAEALRGLGGIYLRNEHNAGFAAGNNQGYHRATGDIVVFVNSDIAAPPALLSSIAHDVRDGALYGPSLAQQLVCGMWLPYLEGWCIAATRATWRRLEMASSPMSGPWDELGFPGPYWEDNDLCFRAMQAGVSLVQTAWPIKHKGGRSAGALVKWGASFEDNRAVFASRVRAVWQEVAS